MTSTNNTPEPAEVPAGDAAKESTAAIARMGRNNLYLKSSMPISPDETTMMWGNPAPDNTHHQSDTTTKDADK